jgi:hypothetical protein
MHLNVFLVYLNIFQCTYNIFMVYLNVCIAYLNVFECNYNIFVVYFNVSIIYINAFIICFNVFHCISMCLNVFINIVIGISPLHSHCNVFVMHTHLQIIFSLYTMTPFPTCYTITFLFFPFLLIHSNFHTIYPYFSHLYITPHSIFHIPCCHWLRGA